MTPKLSHQLPIDLSVKPAYSPNDFVVAPCNADAMAWLGKWPDWPSRGLIIYGPPGCGKSHLARVWQGHAEARLISGVSLHKNDPGLTGMASAVVVEDADRANERALLNLYNAVVEARKTMLLTAETNPPCWSMVLPDLASRIMALATAGIGKPDDSLLQAVLVKQFSDRQLHVGAEVVVYLVSRMERSFAAAREMVAALDEMALDGQRSVSISLAREALAKFGDFRPKIAETQD